MLNFDNELSSDNAQWFKNSHKTLVHTETVNIHLGSDRAPQILPAPGHAGLTRWTVCFFAWAAKSSCTSRTRTSCLPTSPKWRKNLVTFCLVTQRVCCFGEALKDEGRRQLHLLHNFLVLQFSRTPVGPGRTQCSARIVWMGESRVSRS